MLSVRRGLVRHHSAATASFYAPFSVITDLRQRVHDLAQIRHTMSTPRTGSVASA